MATAAQITAFSNDVYTTAKAGTPTNPRGVPDTLAALMVAQAKHESGNFSSNLFQKYNNAFGYSYPASGPSKWMIGAGSIADNGRPIAAYKNIQDSTREIVDWIYRRVKEGKFPANLDTIRTPEEYALLLKNAGYYGDTFANYFRGLTSFFKAPAGQGVAALVGVSVLVWFFTSTDTGKKLLK